MPDIVTREQLVEVLSKSSNKVECVRLFANVSESNRRELAPLALAWYRTAYAGWMDRGRKPEAELPATIPPGFLIDAISIAVLATANSKEMAKLQDWNSVDTRIDRELVYQVMLARRPVWFDDWAEGFVAADAANWTIVRRLNRQGLGSRTNSETYISGVLAGIDDYYRSDQPGIRQRLLDDPELLDHEIWRLFEVQRPNNLNFAARDEWRNSFHRGPGQSQIREGWLETFVQFEKEGRLPRTRLLDACLSALEREFPDSMARWFPRLYDALGPTEEEHRQAMPRYLGLLHSSNGSTVTFALDAINKLDQLGDLTASDALEHLPRVLMDKTKARAKTTLKLLERIANRNPDQSEAIAMAATAALTHPSVEIQQAAWKLIESTCPNSHSNLLDIVRSHAASVSASLRESIEQWLNRAGGSVAPVMEQSVDSREIDDLLTAVGLLPQSLATAARIPELICAIETSSGDITPVELKDWNIPRLQLPISPITTLDELLDSCASAAEGIDSSDEYERLLDGLSRLCDVRPPDFDQRTAALKKRILTRLKGSGAAVFMGDNCIADLYAAIWAWLTGEVCSQTIISTDRQNLQASTIGGQSWIAFPPSYPSWLADALSDRIHTLSRQIAQRLSMPLLSAPTHTAGWIDPLILVERLHKIAGQLSDVAELDQALSLLRLAPDHRQYALSAVARLSQAMQLTEFCQALCHALGADSISVGPTESLWAAAARARNPWQDDTAVQQRYPNGGADSGPAARFDLVVTPADNGPGQITSRFEPPQQELPVHPRYECLPVGRLPADYQPPKMPDAIGHPVRLLHDGLTNFWLNPSGPLTVRLAMTLWPANKSPLLAHGLNHLLQNLDWKSKLWANRIYLESLLPADTPLDSLAMMTLVVGLAAKGPEESATALDVSIEAIGDGRLCGHGLGDALRAALSTGLFTLSRWTKTLTEVARPSTLHAETIRAALTGVFTGSTKPDWKDLAQWLELLLELSLKSDRSLPTETVTWLKSFKGTGKSAKAVKALLAATPNPGTAYRQECNRLALQGRIDRVARWMATEPKGGR